MHKRLDHRTLLGSVIKGISSLADKELHALIAVARAGDPWTGPSGVVCLKSAYTVKECHYAAASTQQQLAYANRQGRRAPILIVGSLGMRRQSRAINRT